jgi:GNAT superfamily N-acetyltransferase
MADASYPGIFLAAEVNGRVAGVAATGPSRDSDATVNTGEVYSIYLDPEVIGQGVGRVLFAAAVDDLASRGFRTGTLWVLTDNQRARRFYEAAGWRPDGATKRDVRADGTLDETRYRTAIGTPGTS